MPIAGGMHHCGHKGFDVLGAPMKAAAPFSNKSASEDLFLDTTDSHFSLE